MRKRIFVLRCLILVALMTPVMGLAQGVNEGMMEVVYLHRLVQFVTWPNPSTQHQVVVVGSMRLKPWFDQVAKEMRQQRLLVRFCADMACATGADILFFDHAGAKLPQMLAQLAGKPVLTVGVSTGFIDHGGAIGFVRIGHRLGFEINLNAIDSHHLYLRSDILPLARRVIGSYHQ
ncbi:MAG: YfiR family protein [Mariprofundales bacterium]|nr:YfiR family protein [Mariprofundales bacterium]